MGIEGLININITFSIFKENSERKVKWEIFFFQVTGLNCGSSGVLWFLVITPDVEQNTCHLYGYGLGLRNRLCEGVTGVARQVLGCLQHFLIVI